MPSPGKTNVTNIFYKMKVIKSGTTYQHYSNKAKKSDLAMSVLATLVLNVIPYMISFKYFFWGGGGGGAWREFD